MAIIREPRFGVGDRGAVVLRFSVYVTESSAALQVFSVGDAVEIIEAYGVRDVGELDGQPCWVRTPPGRITWAGPWQRGRHHG